MAIANAHEAKTNLSTLLNAAVEGNEVIIARRGGAVTRFKRMPVRVRRAKRAVFGTHKDKIAFASDYDTADQEITELFEESASN